MFFSLKKKKNLIIFYNLQILFKNVSIFFIKNLNTLQLQQIIKKFYYFCVKLLNKSFYFSTYTLIQSKQYFYILLKNLKKQKKIISYFGFIPYDGIIKLILRTRDIDYYPFEFCNEIVYFKWFRLFTTYSIYLTPYKKRYLYLNKIFKDRYFFNFYFMQFFILYLIFMYNKYFRIKYNKLEWLKCRPRYIIFKYFRYLDCCLCFFYFIFCFLCIKILLKLQIKILVKNKHNKKSIKIFLSKFINKNIYYMFYKYLKFSLIVQKFFLIRINLKKKKSQLFGSFLLLKLQRKRKYYFFLIIILLVFLLII